MPLTFQLAQAISGVGGDDGGNIESQSMINIEKEKFFIHHPQPFRFSSYHIPFWRLPIGVVVIYCCHSYGKFGILNDYKEAEVHRMNWCRDIFRQALFMSFFIIPIPIGSYTIHSGSSAVVALVSFCCLSLAVPTAYLGTEEARFGFSSRRIKRRWYVALWLLFGGFFTGFTLSCSTVWQQLAFWDWPTVARDLVFIVVMYFGVTLLLVGAYGLSRFGQEDQRWRK